MQATTFWLVSNFYINPSPTLYTTNDVLRLRYDVRESVKESWFYRRHLSLLHIHSIRAYGLDAACHDTSHRWEFINLSEEREDGIYVENRT